MRVADRLARRESTWRELDELLRRLGPARLRRTSLPAGDDVVWLDEDGRPIVQGARAAMGPGPADVIRLGELYRAACADLMLAEAYDLPRETVAYLHALVGRAHNALYRARGFKVRRWALELVGEVPRRLRAEPALRLAALLFWGTFLTCALLSAGRPGFARELVGEAAIEQVDQMYADLNRVREQRDDSLMTGFYIQHNASIGLQCYAWGITLGLGTLYVLLSNALILGAMFGHMATSPHAANFFTFVTAHGPFELTAIVFSGAAGLQLGRGLIVTRGQTRLASLRREARASLPTVGAAVFLFILAAFLEGYVSASALPYPVKAGIALVSATLLVVYLALGGRPLRGARRSS